MMSFNLFGDVIGSQYLIYQSNLWQQMIFQNLNRIGHNFLSTCIIDFISFFDAVT